MSKQKHYDVAEVTWVDAEEVGDTGWNNLKGQLQDAKKPCPVMKTVTFEHRCRQCEYVRENSYEFRG